MKASYAIKNSHDGEYLGRVMIDVEPEEAEVMRKAFERNGCTSWWCEHDPLTWDLTELTITVDSSVLPGIRFLATEAYEVLTSDDLGPQATVDAVHTAREKISEILSLSGVPTS